MPTKLRSFSSLNAIHIPKLRTIYLKDQKIAFRDIGDGYPVICLPPWPSTSLAYVPLATMLKDSYRMICIDLPGIGNTSPPMQKSPTVEHYAEIVEDFINKLRFSNYALLGYSMGGLLAQTIVRRHKVKPKKLILVSTLYSGKAVTDTYGPFAEVLPTVFDHQSLLSLGTLAVEAFFLISMNLTPYYQQVKNSRIVQELIHESEHSNFQSALGLLVSSYDSTLCREFRFNKRKVLVIAGDKDVPAFIRHAERIAARFDQKPIILKDADHQHLFFFPEKSAQLIADFLKK